MGYILGKKNFTEYTCDLCGSKNMSDIKPEGWKEIKVDDSHGVLSYDKCICVRCNKLLEKANSSAGY
jgi:DNA-directed RNA polymerase subunit RPC12/RpoP